jgi:hypothetical protein
VPNPRNYPGTSTKRSPFDTVQTKSRGFQKFARKVEAFDPLKHFKSAFEAFDPFGQQGERIIDVDDHAVRVVGLPPPSYDADPLNTGILQAMDDAVIEEIKDIAADELRDEEKDQSPRAAQAKPRF